MVKLRSFTPCMTIIMLLKVLPTETLKKKGLCIRQKNSYVSPHLNLFFLNKYETTVSLTLVTDKSIWESFKSP